ncbi:bifunctional YncE family protein/alkaline phosphatase family protein, partial [bacterium]|nr:bifunctional YncE family protein/alkaline phosphatase family protein [bacterium]
DRTDLTFIDTKARTVLQRLTIHEEKGTSWCGILWSDDGQTVWVTSKKNYLLGAERDGDGTFQWKHIIQLPGPHGKSNPAPGGLALDPSSGRMLVTLSRNNTLAVVDLETGEVINEIPVGIAPYDVRVVGRKAYVTNWGGRRPREDDLTGPTSGSRAVIDEAGIASSGTVSVVDLDSHNVIREIEVDLHPCGMAVSPDSNRLYVANANSDTVSVLDTRRDEAIDRWMAKPMEDLPFGSAPNAIAVSHDGRTLYVALGGNNCLAVMSTVTGKVQGLIPTGWYPGDVVLTNNGSQLLVANVKGFGSRWKDARMTSDYRGQIPPPDVERHNSHDHLGSVTFVEVPDEAQLKKHSFQVASNMRLPMMRRVMDLPRMPKRIVPVPTRPGEESVFKHVLYIIKENRTYDQVFGDLPQGDGDPSLCLFGREVTPNQHALAEEFVLLDNFYCNGVLSADGHQWTDEGYVTDYIEKSFGGFARSYPYYGNDALAYASSGFIWDHVLRAGLTFRNYGEMVRATIEPASASWADIYKDYQSGRETVKIRAMAQVRGLEPYTCPTFIGFPGKVQDVYRAKEFLREFRQYEEKGDLPNLVMMLLPNNHTVGTTPGYPTPRAAVADNDLALGQIIDAVSHSRFWPETVIFVVEDDPQAGLDHVDGHRTVALCVSPYTQRRGVLSAHYNQSSILRTIELIFDLAPMNQLNMAANPMHDCFTEKPDLTPYDCLPNNIPLDEMNPPLRALRGKPRHYAQKSIEMPLDDIDQADEGTFNRIIWHAVKGYDVAYPADKQGRRSPVSQ